MSEKQYPWDQEAHEAFVQRLLKRCPCVWDVYREHQENNFDDLLLYVFLADIMYHCTRTLGQSLLAGTHDGFACWQAVMEEFEQVEVQREGPIYDAIGAGFAECARSYCILNSERLDGRISKYDIFNALLTISPPNLRQLLWRLW